MIIRAYRSNSASKPIQYRRDYSEGYWAAIKAVRSLITQYGSLNSDTLEAFLSGSLADDTELKEVSVEETLKTEEAHTAPEESPDSLAKTAADTRESHIEQQVISTTKTRPADTTSAEPRTKDKQALTMRNLNVLLGLSSLLFIAAGIAFIASPLMDLVKLIGVLLIVSIFYGGGLILYIKSEKLRPAAVAFVGTGLALIPFGAVVLNVYGNVPSQWAWFVISILGFLLYAAAATIMRSQVVSYLTIGFLLSFTGSTLAVGSATMIWYFTSFIILSLILSAIGVRQPKWLPELFRSPVFRSGQVIAPLTLISSLLANTQLDLWHYELLVGLTALHYFVAWLQLKRSLYIHLFRGFLQLLAIIFWTDWMQDNEPLQAVGWAAISFIHQIISIAYVWLKPTIKDRAKQKELAWVIVQFLFQLLVQFIWLISSKWAVYTSVFYLVWLISGVIFALVFSQSALSIPSIIASFVLPIVISRGLIVPKWPYWVMTIEYVSILAASLIAYRFILRSRSTGWRIAGGALTIGHTLLSTLFVLLADIPAIGFAVGLVLVALIITSTYVYRHNWILLTIFVAIQPTSWQFAQLFHLDGEESLIIFTSFAFMLSLLITTVYWIIKDKNRAIFAISVTNTLLIPFALSFLLPNNWLSSDASQPISLVILIAAILGNLAIKIFTSQAPANLRTLSTVFYIAYFLIGLCLTVTLHAGWLIGLLALGAILAQELSYDKKWPWLLLVSNLLITWLIVKVISLFNITLPWQHYAVTAISGLVFYSMNWMYLCLKDQKRQKYSLNSTWAIWLVGSLITMADDRTQLSGAVLLIVMAVTVAIDGWKTAKRGKIELAAYITAFALSVIINNIRPEIDILVHVHVWSLIILSMAAFRRQEKVPKTGTSLGTIRAIIAVSLLTIFGGAQAIKHGGWYSALCLVEHITLLSVGTVMNKTWAVRWGIIAAITIILSYVRESPYILLSILGTAVIGFAIWRLRKIK